MLSRPGSWASSSVCRDRHGSAKQITDKLSMNVTTSLPLEPDNEGSVHVRTLFMSDLHLGTRGCQAEKLLEFLRDYEADTTSIWSATSSTAGRFDRTGTGRKPTTTSCRSSCARRARARASSTSPATTTSSCATFTARHFGGIEVAERHRAHHGRRPAVPGHPWRPVRRRDSPRALARAAGRQGLRPRDLAQHPLQRGRGVCSACLLVAVAVGQSSRSRTRSISSATTSRRCGGGRAARRRRRDLRPHPPCRDPPARRA